MKFEAENPTLVKIIGASVAGVLFVGSTLIKEPGAAHALFGAATFILGVIGVQLGAKGGSNAS